MMSVRAMRLSLILALAFAAAFPASLSSARAHPPEFATNDQVRLTFTATAFAEPCTVDNGTAVKLTLPLARHSQMQAANSHSPAGAFTLNLSKCPPGMSKVKKQYVERREGCPKCRDTDLERGRSFQ